MITLRRIPLIILLVLAGAFPLVAQPGDDREAPSFTWQQQCAGTVSGVARDLPEDAGIRRNIAAIRLDPDPLVTYNYKLTVGAFQPGISQEATYILHVTDTYRSARARILITDMAGNRATQEVSYTPPDSMLERFNFSFGSITPDSIVIREFRLFNGSNMRVTVDELLLKSGKENLKILAPRGPFVIPARGEIQFIAEFRSFAGKDARGLLLYRDSIGIRDSCGVHYYGQISGQVVKPMIEVTDFDFGQVAVGGRSAPRRIEVRNVSPILGSILNGRIISGLTDTNTAVFRVDHGQTYRSFSLKSGESAVFDITAHPPAIGEYRDTIFTVSNAMEGDPIGWLRVEGVPAGLPASGYNWGTRALGSAHGPDTFLLRNTSLPYVRISGLSLQGADAGQFMVLNQSDLIGRSLLLGESFPVVVQFAPTSPGCKEARIVYQINPQLEGESFSLLQGCASDGVLSAGDAAGAGALMLQASPNPASGPSLMVRYHVPGGRAEFSLLDPFGRQLRSFVQDAGTGGDAVAAIDIEGIPSGLYFLRLHAGGIARTERVMIVR